ncbi:DNA-protecting protein DprA, partial [bacterium]
LKEEDALSLAIVGSRRASFYGLTCAERFALALGELGISIVSGLARGVDTQAHKGALKSGGRTLAVLGSGLNRIYPPENKKLAEGISEYGAVISEFSLNTKPLAHNFPRRNRVISGLSQGVIVVEAARNSGALITADFALEQGREVFAVPGKVDCATSFGANQLIKQGAKLVDSVEDILEELKPGLKEFSQRQALAYSVERRAPAPLTAGDRKIAQEILPNKLSEEEKLVYNLLTDKPRPADELIEEAGLPAAKTMSLLSRLEMQRAVKQLPGKLFMKKETCCG